MTFRKRQNKDWELIINCPGLKGVEDLKVWLQRSGNKRKFYGRVIQLLYMSTVVKVTLQCRCPNSKNCSPKKVNFTLIKKKKIVSRKFNWKGKEGGMSMMENYATAFSQRNDVIVLYLLVFYYKASYAFWGKE